MASLNRLRGFTLIELLVVVAVIALLIAVLLPSLSRAREQARLATDKANCKQIAGMTAAYQADSRGFVPVMFNYFANGNPYHNAPARACWLSVALRGYDARIAKLSGRFDPKIPWNNATRDEYENRLMPAYFTCPFERDQGNGMEYVRTGGGFTYYQWRGRFESYHTWLWEDIVRGHRAIHGEPWPIRPNRDLNGVPKFTVFSWNKVDVGGTFPDGRAIRGPGALSAGTAVTDPSKIAYRQWTDGDVRRMRSGSLSETTVAYCAQGEHMLLSGVGRPVGRGNVGSHRTSAGGGTNAIFADTHVEWVKGTRIGWP